MKIKKALIVLIAVLGFINFTTNTCLAQNSRIISDEEVSDTAEAYLNDFIETIDGQYKEFGFNQKEDMHNVQLGAPYEVVFLSSDFVTDAFFLEEKDYFIKENYVWDVPLIFEDTIRCLMRVIYANDTLRATGGVGADFCRFLDNCEKKYSIPEEGKRYLLFPEVIYKCDFIMLRDSNNSFRMYPVYKNIEEHSDCNNDVSYNKHNSVEAFFNSYKTKTDTIKLYDAYCEANNPHEIDTTIFSYGYDTLYIRNIHNAFCSSEFYRAVVQNEADTLKIDIVNIAGGADCLADCSMGYTIKIPLASFDTMNLKIIDEYFTINKADIIMSDQQEFAPIGAEWYYNERFAFSGDIDYIKFTSEKDTIINGKTCKKITKRHKIYCYDRPDAEFLYTSNDTVYFFDTTFNEFQNLYVFNSAPNDSWTIRIKDEMQETDTVTITVDSVSTKQINGQNMKVLYVTYDKNDENYPESYSSTIIEKIGDVKYMFNWYPWSLIVCDANWTNGLRCYQDSEIGLYSTGIVDSCNYVYEWTDVDIGKREEKIRVFPNPANDYLLIETDLNANLIAELHSLEGRILLSKIFIKSTKLDVTELVKGVYILTIRNRNEIIESKKIIK